MARRTPAPSEVALRPVTVGRHLAVRAALSCAYVDGEGGDGPPPDLPALPDDALVSFLDHALDTPAAPVYADRTALVAVAEAAFAAWTREAERQVGLGLARARLVRTHTGCGSSAGVIGPQPPPEMLAGTLTLAEWAAVRDLPLWEVVMHGAAADSVAVFRQRTQTN